MTYIPVELRRSILEQSSGCCEYCQVHQQNNTVIYHIEHIIAVAHSGQTAEANLAVISIREQTSLLLTL